jgi:Arc/MetJ-type ribon-helix-helix transcriptional regulator
MDVHLSEESLRFLADQVEAGRYPSQDAVLEDAVRRLRYQEQQLRDVEPPAEDPILGMFQDDTDLIDEVVEDAMRIRESRPWRLPPGE